MWVSISIALSFALAEAATLAPPSSAKHPLRLWSDSPGVNWNDSYLIGNGRLGAAIRGGVAEDILGTNEDSFWSGGLMHRVNQDARNQMPKLQSLIREGRVQEAERLADFAYTGQPFSVRHYEPLGDWELHMNHTDDATSYERYLDVESSSAGVYYVKNGTAYLREYIASYPDDIMAIHISSNVSGSVSFNTHLRRGEEPSLNRWEDYSNHVSDDTIVIGGQSASSTGIEFSSGAKVVASGGRVYALGDSIICDNADEATIFYTAWTDYRKQDPKAAVISQLAALDKPYHAVKSAHVEDYQHLSERLSLSYGNSSSSQRSMTTSQRVGALNNGTFDPELISLYFQFGRYLLISSSRLGSLPANLQGIWNYNPDPFWGSKYTNNINLQMNYWPALVTNLEEVLPPLHSLIKTIRTQGTAVAKQMYGVEGFVSHHNTDLWGDSAPQDNYAPGTYWPSAGPWLTFHLMEYYRYTGDKSFIKQHYQTLKAAAQFYVGFLTEYEGYLVTNPTVSPENTYYLPNSTEDTASITLGVTMDTELLWELFGEIQELNELFDAGDGDFVDSLNEIKAKLPPYRTNYYGGLQEWIHDYEEAVPGNDHVSPLWAAFPGNQITSNDATNFKAAAKTLQHRLNNGGASGGWGASWCASLGARFFEPDWQSQCLIHLVGNQSIPDSLLNSGAPADFQIDGNLGGPAGMAEMLLQSHETIAKSSESGKLSPSMTGKLDKVYLIRLLPSLPRKFAAVGGGGSVRGLRTRGGFEVNMSWDTEGSLTSASVTSVWGTEAYVTLGNTTIGEQGGVEMASSCAEGSAVFLEIGAEVGQVCSVDVVGQ